jgi:dephospho-CoA kinase
MGGEVPSGGLLVLLGGGIGAGKSSIGALFASRGFEVLESDVIGHEVLAADPAVRDAIQRRWPDVIVDGGVDRARIARRVFVDDEELAWLESLMHPRIIDVITQRVADTGATRVVVETPLTGLDVVVGTTATEVVRIAVIADRDIRLARSVMRGSDVDDIERRMATQDDDATWRAWADHVIENSGSWSNTERMTEALIDRLLNDD